MGLFEEQILLKLALLCVCVVDALLNGCIIFAMIHAFLCRSHVQKPLHAEVKQQSNSRTLRNRKAALTRVRI